MFIPNLVLGLICLFVAVLLTVALPIQRGRFRNQLWDFITLALFVGAFWWLNVWDALSNLVVGELVGWRPSWSVTSACGWRASRARCIGAAIAITGTAALALGRAAAGAGGAAISR